MSFLFRFSRYISLPIVYEWIELKSFVSLDSAICNNQLRQSYLDLIRTYSGNLQQIFNVLDFLPYSASLNKWHSARGLELRFSLPLHILNNAMNSVTFDGDRLCNNLLASAKHIVVNSCFESNLSICASLINACSTMEILQVRNCYNFTALKNVSPIVIHSLCEIHLSNCNQLDDLLLMAVLRQTGRTLHTLSIEGCEPVSLPVYFTVIVECRNLTSLTLRNYELFLEKVIAKIIIHHPLQRLRKFSSWDLTDLDVRLLVHSHCSTLTSLDLADSRDVSNASVTEMASLRPLHLTSLSLSHCYGVSDAGVLSLAMYLPSLTCIDLRCLESLTNNSLEALFTACKGLKEVHLYNSLHAQDNLMVWSGLNSGLHTLTLSQVDIHPNSLLSLLNKKGLTSLDISYSLSVPLFLSLGLCEHRLTHLNVYGCANITDHDVRQVAPSLVNITDINIGYCTKLTVQSALYVVTGCRALSTLQLPYVSFSVTDELCDALGSLHGKTLTSLDLRLSVPLSMLLKLLLLLPRLREFMIEDEHRDKLKDFESVQCM